jgi:bis(5'-nucleosyl)-tetraphosphatase (symmetrical)
MARYAIGDVQGCYTELRQLLTALRYSADRDQLLFVGDLVNRGPQSLEVLRFVRSLGEGAIVVLGNHDLHLLAAAYGSGEKIRAGDTFQDVLGARDRDTLLEWLVARPLAHLEPRRGDRGGELLIHAGLVPQWSVADALALAGEVEAVLRKRPAKLFDQMYGNKPERWSPELESAARRRFVVNALTRLRFCTDDGVVDLSLKDAPSASLLPFKPWFDVPARASRETIIVFGHWSTMGLVQRQNVLGLDTGCVWGGALTAICLDDGQLTQQRCAGYRAPGEPDS